MHTRGTSIVAALAAMLAAPAAAQQEEALPEVARQEGALPEAATMERLAAEVPAQPWYPDGYYDVRLAAEAQVAETPRAPRAYVGACPAGGGQCYDPVDPLPRRIDASESDPAVRRYGNIALDVARLRQELGQAGYPAALYAGPLSAYEKALVDAASDNGAKAATGTEALQKLAETIEVARVEQAAELPRVLGIDEAATQIVVIRSSGPSAGMYPPGKKLARHARLTIRAGDRIELLTAGSTRTLVGPGTFSTDTPTAGVLGGLIAPSAPSRVVGAVRGGSRGAVGVTLQTNPPSGEVLMVSAFAFRICQRKIANPWDRFACKWNEIETGVARPLSGRFIYQVRWPDGTVRKGAREIAPGETGAVTFKKVGS